MDIYDAWTKALKGTEIIRSRAQALQTFQDTAVSYIFLSSSSINTGDTVVRKGEIIVDRPSLILPPNIPQLEGFEFGEDQAFDRNSVFDFLLVRGISLPSFKYQNKTHQLDVYEGGLNKAIRHHLDDLQRLENVTTGLIAGPEDVWQFSVLIFICSQIARNTELDIRRLLDEFRRKTS